MKCLKVSFNNGDAIHFYVPNDRAHNAKEWYLDVLDSNGHVLICNETEYILLKSNISHISIWDADITREHIVAI